MTTTRPTSSDTGAPLASPPALRARVVTITIAGSGVIALVAGLTSAGGAPGPVYPDLPGAGRAVQWLLPLTRLMTDVAAAVAVGGLLAALALLTSDGPRLRAPAVRVVRDASRALLVWAVASLVGAFATAAVVLGVPAGSVLRQLGSVAHLSQVLVLVLSATAAALTATAATWVRTRAGAAWCLGGSSAALLPPLLTGHPAAGQLAWLGVAGLLAHVLAASAWVGGLAALVRSRRYGQDLVAAVPRFSSLALGCASVVGATGLITAALHLAVPGHGLWPAVGSGLVALVTTGYGALVLAKTGGYVVLVTLGWWHRRRSLPQLAAGRPLAFLRWAVVELVVMSATFGLAVALSRTP